MKALKITKETGYEDETIERSETFIFTKEEATELMRLEIERMFRQMTTKDPHIWSFVQVETITDDEK